MAGFRVIDANAGPNFRGYGDAIVLAWVAEGSRGESEEVRIYSEFGPKRDLLDLLEQPPVALTADAINPNDIYGMMCGDAESIGRADRVARFCKVASTPKRPRVRIEPAARRHSEEFWGTRQHGAFRVLLCPETHDNARKFPNWLELERALKSQEVQVRELRKKSWQEAAAIIESADVVVAVDSAHAHLSGTLDRPTIVLSGPTRPTAFSHMGSVSAISVSREDMECVGCAYGRKFRGRECYPNGCGALKLLPIETITKHVRQSLERQS